MSENQPEMKQSESANSEKSEKSSGINYDEDTRIKALERLKLRWAECGTEDKVKILKLASSLSASEGIDIVIRSVSDDARKVRQEGKKVLGRYVSEVHIPFHSGQKVFREKIEKSSNFSASIYESLRRSVSNEEIKLFLNTLLSAGGKGPYYAWKYFLSGLFSKKVILDFIIASSKRNRLLFVWEYSLERLEVRIRYANDIKLLIADINDYEEAIYLLSGAFDYLEDARKKKNLLTRGRLDPLFQLLCKHKNVHKVIGKNELLSDNNVSKIRGIKALGAINESSGYTSLTQILEGDQPEIIQLFCLDVLSKSGVDFEPRLQATILELIKSGTMQLKLAAFRAIAGHKVQGLDTLVADFMKKYPENSSEFSVVLQIFGPEKAFQILDDLQEEPLKLFMKGFLIEWLQLDHKAAIKAMVTALPAGDKYLEKAVGLFGGVLKKDRFLGLKAAEKILDKLCQDWHKSFNEELKKFEDNKLNEIGSDQEDNEKKGEVKDREDIGDTDNRDQTEDKEEREKNEGIIPLASSEFFENMDYRRNLFENLELSEMEIRTSDFSGALIRNSEIKSTGLTDITFKGSFIENAVFEEIMMRNVSFENSIFKNVVFKGGDFKDCRFSGAVFWNTTVEGCSISDVIFSGARFLNSKFDLNVIHNSSFAGAALESSSIDLESARDVNFSGITAKYTDFPGSIEEFHSHSRYSVINEIAPEVFDTLIGNLLSVGDIYKNNWFEKVWLCCEMEKQYFVFMDHNLRRQELNVDTPEKDRKDLVELIPLIIHSNISWIPSERKEDIRFDDTVISGLRGYIPTSESRALFDTYFEAETPLISDPGHCDIDSIFTVGYTGTISQAEHDEISYFVFLGKGALENGRLAVLQSKLESLKIWSHKRFNISLRFSVFETESFRECREGGTEENIPWPAYIDVLKETFYVSGMYIAGRLPLWFVLPPGTKKEYYAILLKYSEKNGRNYIDLGNPGSIDQQDYQASLIWLLLEILKTPCEAVTIMALVEMYALEGVGGGVVCETQKNRWAGWNRNFLNHDHSLYMYAMVTRYYEKKEDSKSRVLVQLSFFLKMGIISFPELERSIFGVRRDMIKECMGIYKWDEKAILNLGLFSRWQADKKRRFGTEIIAFITSKYEMLNRLNDSGEKIFLKKNHRAVLSRKMVVRFSTHEDNIERRIVLFYNSYMGSRLFLYCTFHMNEPPVWEASHENKRIRGADGKFGDILFRDMRLERIAAWLVLNASIPADTQFKLISNPTSVLPDDFGHLYNDIREFFSGENLDNIKSSALLESENIVKLMIIPNFNLRRKLSKINEFSVVYVTTWGRIGFRSYEDIPNLEYVVDAVEYFKNDISYSFSDPVLTVHIPVGAEKSIKLEEEVEEEESEKESENEGSDNKDKPDKDEKTDIPEKGERSQKTIKPDDKILID